MAANIPTETPAESFEADVWPSYQEYCADPTSKRKAKAASIFAYHFHEWVYEYYQYHDQPRLGGAAGARVFLGNLIDHHCPELELIGDIANAAKHRFLTVNLPRTVPGATDAFIADRGGLVINPDGRMFGEVLETVVEYWRQWI